MYKRQTKIMVYVTQGTMRNIRNDMFKHMESLPIKYFDTHKHGDIMSMYTNDVDTLRQMVSQSIPQFINSLISIVNVLIYMIILSVPLTLVSIVMVMLVIWASNCLLYTSISINPEHSGYISVYRAG